MAGPKKTPSGKASAGKSTKDKSDKKGTKISMDKKTLNKNKIEKDEKTKKPNPVDDTKSASTSEDLKSEAKDSKDLKAVENTKDTKDGKKKDADEEQLSEEDEKLKNDLEMLVVQIKGSQRLLYDTAIAQLKEAIRTSTSSMTAVPKPLKFLRPHYPDLVAVYEKWTSKDLKPKLADILSVLAMTFANDGNRDLLKYCLAATPPGDLVNVAVPSSASSISSFSTFKYEDLEKDGIASWGHEYMRHLALEIGEEFNVRTENDESTEDLLALALKIVPHLLQHNAEADAVDLLAEIESIERLPKYVDKNTFTRVCLYIVSCVPLLPPPDDLAFLNTAYNIYLNHGQLTHALAVAIRIDDELLIRTVFDATEDTLVQQQLAFILARQQYFLQVEEEDVHNCLSNTMLSDDFLYLAKELNLLEPKVPEDIYKSFLETYHPGMRTLASSKQNLATAFANAFINCGYGEDKLMNTTSEKHSWIYQTKDSGIVSTTASWGMLYLWDPCNGLQFLDKYFNSQDRYIKSGAILGVGVANAGVYDEADPALGLLDEYLGDPDPMYQASALLGIGIAYAGSRRTDLIDRLAPIVSDPKVSMHISSLAALALGHIFVGSADGDIASTILQTLLERDQSQLSDKWTRFTALGLGLLFLGKYERTEAVLETIKAIDHPISPVINAMMTICSYAGTGNVLQIQQLLKNCTIKVDSEEEIETEAQEEIVESQLGKRSAESNPESATENPSNGQEPVSQPTSSSAPPTTANSPPTISASPPSITPDGNDSGNEKLVVESQVQALSVLGIATIAMGEEIGQEMVLRHFGHLMHYGEAHIRRAVPLAMGLVSASNPEMKVFDTLSRYSHDADLDVAATAVFSMGVVGAGTNNARLDQLLRQLASYYAREPDTLFTVRIAQGLVHLGKGALTLNPFNTERQIMSRVSMAGLLTVCVALMDPKSFILGSSHVLLYYICSAIKPRMLVTVDEELQPIKVNVRVGQAVDVVGQVGKPRTITGWTTHSTPVLLAYGERAELEDDEYTSLSHSMEGIVILKKNKDRADSETK